MIFDLGFGQCGLLDRRPHHRAEAAIEQPVSHEFVQLAGDGGLGAEIHRGVGIVPFADAAQPLDLLALHAQPVRGEGAAFVAQLRRRHLVLGDALGAVLLLDLPFDGQAMAVPAGHIGRVLAQHLLGADDEILEDVVEAGARMDVAIGVDRPVMEHEQRPPPGGRAQPAIEVHRRPAREPFRLGRRQASLHRKIGLGQEQRRAVVAGGGIARLRHVFGHVS